MKSNNKIIVAPLNWGLGHATRCVPIITALIKSGFVPILASDGKALELLKFEFPDLESLELPCYGVKYGEHIIGSLCLQIPKILKAVRTEQKILSLFIAKNKEVVGLISDNRFGMRSSKVPSIYITHQPTVLSGFTTLLTSKIHQMLIDRFDECWIPDNMHSEFSGRLSNMKRKEKQKFIGVLSRFEKKDLEKNIAVLIILSGPEPNRTTLAKKLIGLFKNEQRNIVFVLGEIAATQKSWKRGNCTFYNYLLTTDLQEKINAAQIVLCRSGYSSILDLATLGKKAFFIPTKNQPEQEYLAFYLQEKNIAPYSNIEDFTIKKLLEVSQYTGFNSTKSELNSELFHLFHRK